MENAFIGQKAAPTETELNQALGSSRKLWDALLRELSEQLGLAECEWNSPYPKYGWSLRVKRGKRNILYMGPRKGGFMAAFVFGERAVTAIRQGKFAKSVLQLLDAAPKYPEGTGVRMEITNMRDVATAVNLAAVKLAN